MTSIPGSIQVRTPKRLSKMPANQAVNLNHLLNFTLPPRQTPSNLPRRSRRAGTAQGGWNKERFVNAQYRFVMNPTGDYTVHFADPDIFFQWQDILQVIIPRSSALASAAASGTLCTQDEGYTTCPICLSPPTAPRMTKCGHVFCFPCILQYLSTSDNKWARCPICFDSVNERQLKNVKWYDGPIHDIDRPFAWTSSLSSSSLDSSFDTTPREGSTMQMRLIQRPQITTLALPRSSTWPSDLLPPHQAPFYFLPDVFSFSKFMLATPEYLISSLNSDLDEINTEINTERRLLSVTQDALGLIFLGGAEQRVKEQISKAVAFDTPILKAQIDRAKRDQREIEERCAFHARRRKAEKNVDASPALSDTPTEFVALCSGGVVISPQPVVVTTSEGSRPCPQGRNQLRQRRNLNPPPPSTSTYYYYQAASGLPLFLHPLDIKILLSHFSDYSAFPDTITIRVESFAEGTVNDDLRKRCKYLAHLPEGTDVVFIEADLEGVVGAEGLKNFEGPLRMRTSRRKGKERKDNRAKARAEEKEKTSTISWSAGTANHSVLIPDYTTEDIFAVGDSVRSGESRTPQPTPAAVAPGAWGARSFASALHSPPTQGRIGGQQQQQHVAVRGQNFEDVRDMDMAWHEFEQRSGASGSKKRDKKLIVLGSGGGGARRR